ncbi:hypothetical protein HMPREF1639_04530 [Peptostreptococcus sp. MV1]|nr:cell wall-binding repeat-containing protein [uncultured Peptostreptococcus sp.]KGF13003.1 hypothetical protein HMPREF1639_04530 [Peptostreptococcus sp. MV1]
MKKIIKCMALIVVFLIVYIGGGKLLDKLYFDKFDVVDYTGDTRYDTVNTVLDKRFKKADTAIVVNTEMIEQIVSIAPYAYNSKYPVFYVESYNVKKPVYEQMKKLGIKKVVLIGGTNSLNNRVERSFKRNGYKVSRIVEYNNTDLSIRLANIMADKKKVKAVGLVSNDVFDLPNAISFSPYAQKNNIPIIVISGKDDDPAKLKNYIDKKGIKKVFIITNKNTLNRNYDKMFENVVKISGKDRYEVNRNIMDRLYKRGEKIYVSKGGEVLHKRSIASGQLINAMAIAPLAADNNAPLLLIENNYLATADEKLVEERKYTQLNQVGFKIERRNFFNVERFKLVTTIFLILLSIFMVIRLLIKKDSTLAGL